MIASALSLHRELAIPTVGPASQPWVWRLAGGPLAPARIPRAAARPVRRSGGDRPSLLVFGVCIALIALHVADDAVLQPQPGTSAADHLVSGLVQLAALALAAVAYPRLSGFGRGVTALCVGLFGLIGATEGIYYTWSGRPSGDDFSGLLSAVAAAALLGVGAVSLWTARRRDTAPARTALRRAGLGAAALVVGWVVVQPVGYSYVMTHVARAPVERVALGERPAERVSFRTADGLTLRGDYVPSANGAAVAVVFGRKGTQAPARFLARRGFGVLIFDRRREGASDGDPNALGWSEAVKDVRAAADFLKRRPDVDPQRIGGLGLSVGGETLLHAAADGTGLKAVVAEGVGSRSAGEYRSLPGSNPWTAAFMLPQTLATAVFSDSAPPPHLIDLVAKMGNRHTLLIFTPRVALEAGATPELYRALNGPKSLWAIPEAGHVGGLRARPHEYEHRVTRFFERALLSDTEES
jgi:hypothetical protein